MTDASFFARTGTLALIAAAALWSAPVSAQSGSTPYYQPIQTAEAEDAAEVPAQLRRQTVSYAGSEAPGTIIIDTPNTYLYYVLGGGKAIRYGIGVGREGFTWSGVKSVERKTEWPDWIPPAEMLERQPYLPRFVAGGPGNPLGARAMYLAGTIYRIHGTNEPCDDRQARLERLHPHAQRGRDRPLCAGERRHQGRGPADDPARPRRGAGEARADRPRDELLCAAVGAGRRLGRHPGTRHLLNTPLPDLVRRPAAMPGGFFIPSRVARINAGPAWLTAR